MSAPSDLRRIAEELLIIANGQATSDNSHQSARPGELSELELIRLAKTLYQMRRLRGRHFDESLFGEPAWDIILDLFVEKLSGRKTLTKGICAASQAADATALRWIANLAEAGLVLREDDQTDRRRVYVSLSPRGEVAVRCYLREVSEHLRAVGTPVLMLVG